MIGVLDTAPYVAGALGVGGVGVLASRRRELIRRWCTWAVTAPIVGGAVLLGTPGEAALAAALTTVAAIEYGRLVGLPLTDRCVAVVGLATLIVVAAVAPANVPAALLAVAAASALLPVLTGDATGGARRAAYGLLGVAWLAPLAGIVLLGGVALPLIVAVSLADVGAWCAGRALRGPRLSPLSPAKTWAGAAGGAAVGLGMLALLGAFTPVTALAVAIAAPVGDLFESMLKRGAGVKDAGTWLPGFGGLLDRIDSLAVAAPVTLLLIAAAGLTGSAP